MAWSELSDDLTIWSLPAERTKNGTAHNVPVSAPVRSLLKSFMCEDPGERHASGQLVFPGVAGRPFAGWSKAKAALDKAIMAARAKAAETGGKLQRRLRLGTCTICAAQSLLDCRGWVSDLR